MWRDRAACTASAGRRCTRGVQRFTEGGVIVQFISSQFVRFGRSQIAGHYRRKESQLGYRAINRCFRHEGKPERRPHLQFLLASPVRSFPRVFFEAQQFKLTFDASEGAWESRSPARRGPQPAASVRLID